MKYGFAFAVLLAGLTIGWTPNFATADEAHDEQEEHEAYDVHEDVVRLSSEQIGAFGIEMATVESGDLNVHISLPGEVQVNPDRFAHIVPRVSGVVQRADKNLGDRVQQGEVMAVLESRELSDLKSEFLASYERLSLAKATFEREETLWKDGISAERDYLHAKQLLAESRIAAQSAEHKLHALGFSDAYLKALPTQPDAQYTRYEIIAPFDGVVVAKHITLGEYLNDDAEVFSVADLRSVWVMLTVYQKDLPYIKMAQPVRVTAREGAQQGLGAISYISPVIDEETRTATARVVLRNADGRWRPGLFVNGAVETQKLRAPVLIAKTALQRVEDRLSVFVLDEDGFEPHPVTLGRANETHVEVVAGLAPGQRYVTQGAFTLKAQLEKATFGDGHAH